MRSERTSYTERTPWPGFANAIVWGAVILVCYPILAGWDHDLPAVLRWPIVGAIVCGAAGMKLVLGGLTVHVQETRLVVHLGAVPLVKKVVQFEDIVELSSIEYEPLRDFGGWGVRGFGKRRAWTSRGNQAVELQLVGGRSLLIGSDHPHRLEQRIRAAAGDRIGTDAPDD